MGSGNNVKKGRFKRSMSCSLNGASSPVKKRVKGYYLLFK